MQPDGRRGRGLELCLEGALLALEALDLRQQDTSKNLLCERAELVNKGSLVVSARF